jgi:hypothetical protein
MVMVLRTVVFTYILVPFYSILPPTPKPLVIAHLSVWPSQGCFCALTSGVQRPVQIAESGPPATCGQSPEPATIPPLEEVDLRSPHSCQAEGCPGTAVGMRIDRKQSPAETPEARVSRACRVSATGSGRDGRHHDHPKAEEAVAVVRVAPAVGRANALCSTVQRAPAHHPALA